MGMGKLFFVCFLSAYVHYNNLAASAMVLDSLFFNMKTVTLKVLQFISFLLHVLTQKRLPLTPHIHN